MAKTKCGLENSTRPLVFTVVLQAAGQVKILIFLVEIIFPHISPIHFVMQGLF